MRGKIIKGIAGFYYVHDGISQVYECKAKGVFRSRKIKPLVGDDVEFTVLDEKEQTGNITDILERKNELIRPAVANIDQAMIVFAVTDPEPNLNLLDRFLVTMEMQGVPAVICFNKMDLGTGERERELRQIYEAAGYSVYFTSANDKESVSMVRELLKGKTTALAGPSGVGKSSLTNQIQPEAAMETGAISEKIRALLLDPANTAMGDTCELLLYEAARAQLVHEVIAPALAVGKVVLCDRFYDSTTCYQAFADGLDRQMVRDANNLAVAGTHPALTLVYHITPEQAALRMAARGAADRMEAKGMAFQERVYQGFCAIAAEEPARVKLIDATASIADVFAQTVELVRAYGLDIPQDAVAAALAKEAE